MLFDADVDALLLELHRAVGGEKISDVIPHLAIEIEAVGVLQVENSGFIVQPLHARFERRKIRWRNGWGTAGTSGEWACRRGPACSDTARAWAAHPSRSLRCASPFRRARRTGESTAPC